MQYHPGHYFCCLYLECKMIYVFILFLLLNPIRKGLFSYIKITFMRALFSNFFRFSHLFYKKTVSLDNLNNNLNFHHLYVVGWCTCFIDRDCFSVKRR